MQNRSVFKQNFPVYQNYAFCRIIILFAKNDKIIIPEALRGSESTTSSLNTFTEDMYEFFRRLRPESSKKAYLVTFLMESLNFSTKYSQKTRIKQISKTPLSLKMTPNNTTVNNFN